MAFKAKNFLIAFLVLLAIYQTTNLWFGNYSSHNFLNFFENKLNMTNIPKEMSYNVESIIINTGNDKFIRQYNNFYDVEYKRAFDEVILDCVTKGKYKYEENFDINYILENKSIIYTYAYNVKTNDLESVFGLKFKNMPNDVVFNKIAIVPSISSPTDIKVIFFHSEREDGHIFRLDKHNLVENIYYTIDNFSNFENKSFYNISNLKNGIELLPKNDFIPKTKDMEIFINKVKAINPLEQDGGILLSGLEKYIEIYFENYAIKWDSIIDDTYTYKDDNTVIKYYANNVLEYVNYKTSLAQNFSPYALAIDFLEKDINIKNEYYLTNYEKTDEGIIFYFDYKINNFPITLSDEIKEYTDMQSMIEITVFENKVSKYKRIIYKFYIDKEKNNFNEPFLEALDKVFFKRKEENLDTQSIDTINLEYKFDILKDELSLQWKIKIKDEVYFESIEDNEEIWTGN